MLSDLALALYLANCAPKVAPGTMTAVVSVESERNPYAIDDDTARRSYMPSSADEALRIIASIGADNYDLGLAQVNRVNFAAYGVTPAQMLDPCENLRVGADLLDGYWRQSYAHFGSDPGRWDDALRGALSLYNSGSSYHEVAYANAVVAAAHAPQTRRVAVFAIVFAMRAQRAKAGGHRGD